MTDGRAREGVEAAALRLVLGLVLTRREAAERARSLQLEVDALWPSAVVAALADIAAADPARWRELGALLDARLAPWLADLEGRSLAAALHALPGGDELDVPALAALVWSLVRRRSRALAPVLARLVCEVEALIVADAGRRTREPRRGAPDLRLPSCPLSQATPRAHGDAGGSTTP